MEEKKNYDNYLCEIVETIHHDNYTSYELVRDNMTGYYVNINLKKDNKRFIIATFQNSELDNSNNYFHAQIYWKALKIENMK